jgi:two-component system chemotaxis sensor kinase CheA
VKKDVDPETKEIIDSFVAEGYERLDDAEIQLEKLGHSDDLSCLNSVFRLFHSVKGSAGFLGFENIKLLTHEAETLLEFFIKGKQAVGSDALDLILKTIDSLRSMIGMVERDSSDEEGAAEARMRTDALSACLALLRGGQPGAATPAAAQPSPPTGEEEVANEILLSELVTAEMAGRFLAECADLVDEVERRTLEATQGGTADSGAVNEIFRAIHTIKGNAGFFGHALLERLCMGLEGTLDKARRGEVPANEALTNAIIERVDVLRQAIGTVVLVDPEAGTRRSAELAAPARPAMESKYKPLGDILVDLGAVREDEIKKALEIQERPLGEILVESGVAAQGDITRALELQRASAGGAERAVEEIQRKEIRVDTAKLDKLFELVGELITAEAMVLNNPDLAGLKLDNFQKSFSGLNKISREIQETAMMIRMIPLEGLFHKMTRLVRDLSRKFDKPIDLRSAGQETEMDKNVIEQVSDPLVHILRNAIDHGIETRAVRAAAGKPQTGTIQLEARYEGSEIWISVRDDGAGLDRARILAKAVEKGLIKGDPALVPDDELWKVIFEPGFSTATEVTEVSGRGVGMDVVKKNLERIRGRVDIKTETGKGTDFILKIPLTMAIIDGITLRCGSNHYSIPLGDILEFFKASPGQLTVTEHGGEAVNLRGGILPLIKLGEVFAIADATLDPVQGIIIVVQSAGRRACILIDEVVGNQQIVVKSLSEYLGKVEGVSGCSILGDGTVSFIIDTGRLISLRLE